MAPELRRLRSWRSHSLSNLNGDTEGDVFQGRRMNLRSRKGDKKDMMNANVSEGSDDQANVGPQLRSGRKKVGAKKTSRILSSSQSSDMKELVLPASTGATMILDDSSDESEDIELPETERTVALYDDDSPLHKKQRREASSKCDECPCVKKRG
eukprot:505110_1